MQKTTIGVLALQGAFQKHITMLRSLDVDAIEVRKAEELALCDGLIIPGGESTTILKQLQFAKMVAPLSDLAKTKPVFGTCAGLILIARQIDNDTRQPLDLLDISVKRNAYGRQIDSFHAKVECCFDNKQKQLIDAFFIRAPQITQVGKEVEVLAYYQDSPVLVKEGHILGATFHSELTNNPALHKFFLKMVVTCQKNCQ